MKPVIRIQRKEVDHVHSFLSPSPPLPRDYHRQNLRELSMLQSRIQASRSVHRQSPPPFKLRRFTKVAPLVFREKREIEEMRTGRERRREERLDKVVELVAGRKDYVKENAISVISSPARRSPPPHTDSPQSLNPAYGRVPSYIRRYQRAAQADYLQHLRAEEKKRHPGLRLLSEVEKTQKRSEAIQKRAETVIALNKIPLGVSAPSLLRRKKELEGVLDEVDVRLGELERPQVYVPEDL